MPLNYNHFKHMPLDINKTAKGSLLDFETCMIVFVSRIHDNELSKPSFERPNELGQYTHYL